VAGHGLLLDCHTLTVTPTLLPGDDVAEWVVIRPPTARDLAESAYAERVAEIAVAETEIGPLRTATLADVAAIGDPVIRRRARHVVSENERVRAFAAAMSAGEVANAGELMRDSHRSLRDDFESSTPSIDMLCEQLFAMDGVLGARITGGGWGGSVIALTRPGALRDSAGGEVVRPASGASVRRY
jgi:galactokinase